MSEQEKVKGNKELEKKINYIFYVIVAIFGIYWIFKDVNKPSGCDCIPYLTLKKNNLQNVPMSDEEYDFWKKCYDAYDGPAGATLDCYDK
jgi:hypothetical protein